MSLSYWSIFSFVAETSLNGTHDATLKICVSLSLRPDARIQAGLNSCIRSRGEYLVGATAFSRDIQHVT